jgi:phosphomannomutase
MEGATIKKFLSRMPQISAHILFGDPDGAFPNHEANPLKESTLTDLKREVCARGAILGVAFDGDGDRVGFVDETGAMIGADIMTALVSRELLKKNPGAKILYDLRSRSVVGRAIRAAGGQPEVCRVGHAFIKQQMRETDALFAGELSCHFYAREFFSVESADYMVLLVLQLLQNTGKPLSELARDLYEEAHSGEINYRVADRAAALHALEEKYGTDALEILRIDGLTFKMHTWWFNVRPSNTEPLLRLNVEAQTLEDIEFHLAEIEKIIGATRATH